MGQKLITKGRICESKYTNMRKLLKIQHRAKKIEKRLRGMEHGLRKPHIYLIEILEGENKENKQTNKKR